MDNYYFTALAYERLRERLTLMLNLLMKFTSQLRRIIKSENEIELQKRAGKIVEKAMQGCYRRPGTRCKTM